MMNRIESFNGQMLIESAIGKGCSVQIDIPY
jgi:signal transduction histidine kinase